MLTSLFDGNAHDMGTHDGRIDTEVAQVTHGKPSELVSMKINRGVLQISNKLSREVIYTVKNSGRNHVRIG